MTVALRRRSPRALLAAFGLLVLTLARTAAAQAEPERGSEGWHAHHTPGRVTLGVGGGVQMLYGLNGVAELDAFVLRRLVLTANFQTGVATFAGPSGGTIIGSWMAGGGARVFLGDTFLLSGTLMYRQERLEWEHEYDGSGVTRSSFAVMGLSLGNRWDHESWFIGVDWFGFVVPLKSFSERITITDKGHGETKRVGGAGWEVRAVTLTVGPSF